MPVPLGAHATQAHQLACSGSFYKGHPRQIRDKPINQRPVDHTEKAQQWWLLALCRQCPEQSAKCWDLWPLEMRCRIYAINCVQ